MLKRQCDSCTKQATVRSTDRVLEWTRVSVTVPGDHVFNYDLCPECVRMPMTFGTIALTYRGGK